MNLLTRREAAAHLRIGLSTFDRHVQPFVPSIRIGKRVMFQREDLDTWVVRQKDSKSSLSEAGTTFASPGKASSIVLRSGRATAERLNLVAWARELGIAKMTIRRRLAAGWTVARALSEPAVTGTHWA